MTRLAERGRARLKLRLPGWRARFEQASGETFLDICEAYELAWIGLDYWTRADTQISSALIAEYKELIASLEIDAKCSAVPDPEGAEPDLQ